MLDHVHNCLCKVFKATLDQRSGQWLVFEIRYHSSEMNVGTFEFGLDSEFCDVILYLNSINFIKGLSTIKYVYS